MKKKIDFILNARFYSNNIMFAKDASQRQIKEQQKEKQSYLRLEKSQNHIHIRGKRKTIGYLTNTQKNIDEIQLEYGY